MGTSIEELFIGFLVTSSFILAILFGIYAPFSQNEFRLAIIIFICWFVFSLLIGSIVLNDKYRDL